MDIFTGLLCFLFIALVISIMFITLAVYFIPIIIAYIRKHNNFTAICLLNLFVGWTFLGWLASLLWSLNSDIQQTENSPEE